MWLFGAQMFGASCGFTSNILCPMCTDRLLPSPHQSVQQLLGLLKRWNSGLLCVIITLEMGRFSCESGIWEHSAQCTRLEENHQLRLNSSIPRTEVHCLLGPQPRNSTEDRDFLFSRHIKCTSLKAKGGKGWKRRATWLIWKESMLAPTPKH